MIKISRKTTLKIITQQLSKSKKSKWPQGTILTQSKKITKIKFVTKIENNLSALEDQNSQYSHRNLVCSNTDDDTCNKTKQDQKFPQTERI